MKAERRPSVSLPPTALAVGSHCAGGQPLGPILSTLPEPGQACGGALCRLTSERFVGQRPFTVTYRFPSGPRAMPVG